MQPPVPPNEAARLAALRELKVLDTPPEADFDDIVTLASDICGAPISLVTMVDANRQWFKSKVGISVDETARDLSFCAHAIMGRALMVVPDASTDSRFADNPFVQAEHGIRFYAGAPLVTDDGNALGTLCVLDHTPHRLSLDQTRALRALARQVTEHLQLRRLVIAPDPARPAVAIQDTDVARPAEPAPAEPRPPEAGPAEPRPPEAGPPEPGPAERRPVDLAYLVQGRIEQLRPIADARNTAITLGTAVGAVVRADPRRLAQALDYVIFTALKAAPPGGRVAVHVLGPPNPGLEVAHAGGSIQPAWQDDLDGSRTAEEPVPQAVAAVLRAHGAVVAVTSEAPGSPDVRFEVRFPPL